MRALDALRVRSIAFIAVICSLVAFQAQAQEFTPPPLSAYGKLPGFEDAARSPSGELIAAVAEIQGKRLLIIKPHQGDPLRVEPLGPIKLRGLGWAGDDTVLLMLSQTEDLGFNWRVDDMEVYKMLAIPAHGGDFKVMFADQRDIATGVFGNFGTRKVDGKWRIFAGGVRMTETGRSRYQLMHMRRALFSLDPVSLKPSRIEREASEGRYRDWIVGPDGRTAATFNLAYSNGDWDIRGPDGKVLASGKDPAGRTGLVGMGRKADEIVYYEFDEQLGERVWYALSLTDGSRRESLPDIEVSRIYRDRATGLMIGYREGTTKRRNVFFGERHAKISEKIDTAFKGYNVTFIDWTLDMSHVILQVDGNSNAGTWFHVDINTFRADPIGIERPDILPEAVGPFSIVDYTAQDGLEMDGILTLPPGREAKNLPVIMLPHGGPASYDTASFDWWAQAFASRGYAVFQPNFRGSTNRGAAFKDAGDGEWGSKMQTDISDALAMLAEKGIADPKRACIVGASYGGYAALAGVTLQQGIYRCAVSVAGISDLALMRRTDLYETGNNKMLKISFERQLGPKSNLDDLSPRSHAAAVGVPIMLIHGRDDTVVYFEQSEKMADALKDAHKPYEFVELEGEDHWLSKAETRQHMLNASVAFVEEHNPPG